MQTADICAALLDLVFPRNCIVCGKEVFLLSRFCVCRACREKLAAQPPMITAKKHGCDLIMSPLPYRGEIRRAMIEYKFNGIKYPGYSFARVIADRVKDMKIDPKKCVIIAVPIHVSRDRDYNQSEVIARYLAEFIGAEYLGGVLCKIKPIDRLSGMEDCDKKFFIRNSFEFNLLADIRGRDVIVADDVYTSGATLSEVSRLLRINGANRVYAVTACYSRKE